MHAFSARMSAPAHRRQTERVSAGSGAEGGSRLCSPRYASLVYARSPWGKSRSVEGEKLALEKVAAARRELGGPVGRLSFQG